jgi:hypothetical protein
MLGAMPKTKAKRPSSTKSRNATKAARAPAKKAKAKAPAKRKPSRSAKSAATGGIDPRVVAAIGLALEDEARAIDRAKELARPQSPWVALGRVRAVKTR